MSSLAMAYRGMLDATNGRQSFLIILVHGAVVLLSLVCATVLTALHVLPIDYMEGILGAAITFGSAVSGGVVLRQVPKSNPSVPSSVLQAAIEAASKLDRSPPPPYA